MLHPAGPFCPSHPQIALIPGSLHECQQRSTNHVDNKSCPHTFAKCPPPPMRTIDPSHPRDHPVNWSYSRFVDEATEEGRNWSDPYYWLVKQDSTWQSCSLLVQLSLPCTGQYLGVYNLTCSFSFSHACELTLLPGAFSPLPASTEVLVFFRCKRSWLLTAGYKESENYLHFWGVVYSSILAALLPAVWKWVS